jgi:SAM-dependent methyltransferase
MQEQEDTALAYFERVMEQHRQTPGHVYANNPTWQRTYQHLCHWIRNLRLNQHGRVLEIGCGTGVLQDLVPDYVGLDIARSSTHWMHQPFYVASSTHLPFADNSFDAVWSVWVLEHVPQPDKMLAEMRRVVRPDGAIFLRAAYGVGSWVAQGLHRRSFHELTPTQRMIKTTLFLRTSLPYRLVIRVLKRTGLLLRYLHRRTPTRLHYAELQPNYDTYWDYDADACVSLDSYDVALYFLSRGDQSQQGGVFRSLLLRSQAQTYTVRK